MAFYYKQIHLYSCSCICASSNTVEGRYSPIHFNSCEREQSVSRSEQSSQYPPDGKMGEQCGFCKEEKDLVPCQVLKPDSFVIQFVTLSLYWAVLVPLLPPKILQVQSYASTIILSPSYTTLLQEGLQLSQKCVFMWTLCYT
jgi:hypothetical protein